MNKIDYSKLLGTTEQKLESLYFLRNNARRSLWQAQKNGWPNRLDQAEIELEAIQIEIEKLGGRA